MLLHKNNISLLLFLEILKIIIIASIYACWLLIIMIVMAICCLLRLYKFNFSLFKTINKLFHYLNTITYGQ